MSVDFKYNQHTLKKIESLFHSSEYIIRYERGNFDSGYCLLEEKKVVVVNKFYDVEARINCLLDILQEVLIMENNMDEKQIKFYNQLLIVSADKNKKVE